LSFPSSSSSEDPVRLQGLHGMRSRLPVTPTQYTYPNIFG